MWNRKFNGVVKPQQGFVVPVVEFALRLDLPTPQVVDEKQDVEEVVCDRVLTIDLHKVAKSVCRNDSWSRIARCSSLNLCRHGSWCKSRSQRARNARTFSPLLESYENEAESQLSSVDADSMKYEDFCAISHKDEALHENCVERQLLSVEADGRDR